MIDVMDADDVWLRDHYYMIKVIDGVFVLVNHTKHVDTTIIRLKTQDTDIADTSWGLTYPSRIGERDRKAIMSAAKRDWAPKFTMARMS